jgi:hypothetical protein
MRAVTVVMTMTKTRRRNDKAKIDKTKSVMRNCPIERSPCMCRYRAPISGQGYRLVQLRLGSAIAHV